MFQDSFVPYTKHLNFYGFGLQDEDMPIVLRNDRRYTVVNYFTK